MQSDEMKDLNMNKSNEAHREFPNKRGRFVVSPRTTLRLKCE